MTRNKICKPEDLLSILKDRFGIDFNEYNISNIKSAKSIFYLGDNHDIATFLLRFSTDPNFVEKLVNSIPEEKRDEVLILEPYSPSIDHRTKVLLCPKWFKEPIEKGETLLYDNFKGKMTAYIDTTDSKQLIVYIRGYYYRPKG